MVWPKSRIRHVVRHPLSPFKWRTLHAIVVLTLVILGGTVTMHYLEGWSYVDSFYFMSLIATTQGPSASPHTDAGKVFAAIMSFISVGSVLSAIAFIFGPMFGTLVKVGIDHVEAVRTFEKTRTTERKDRS